MSDTKNVKLGVCSVFFDGVDLGYTKGGVEVSVKTDTHKVNIDQFGKTPITEYIMGRECTAKVPLAETTIENMVRIMPGATMTSIGGAQATGTITIAVNPEANDTIVVNGMTITFKAAAAADGEVTIGAAASDTAANLANALNSLTVNAIAVATYSAAGAVVTVTYDEQTDDGNAFTLATGTAGSNVTVSGAALTGGVTPTSKYVSVTTGIGTDLLSIAKELRLHPVGKPLSDKSEDFVMPLTATAGALSFAYKLEDERVYNVDFNAFPDPNTGKLFSVGL